MNILPLVMKIRKLCFLNFPSLLLHTLSVRVKADIAPDYARQLELAVSVTVSI